MADSKDDVLLRLTIKGGDPNELSRFAQQTGEMLKSEQRLLLQQLSVLHKAAMDDREANVRKEINAEIEIHRQRLGRVKEFMDAESKEQKRTADAASKIAADAAKAQATAAQDAARKIAVEQEQAQLKAAFGWREFKGSVEAAFRDPIAIKLVMKGADPDAVLKLTTKSRDELERAAVDSAARLAALRQQAAAAETDVVRRKVDDEIREEQRGLSLIQQVARAKEIESNRVAHGFDRMLERLENLTVVAQGAWNIISGGFQRFKDLGDQIDRVTNIYGSLRGSIDELREATRGEVSDIDLITTKNRALEMDLRLTDKQFGIVSAAADHFADALGENTKQALDGLIEGLATGRSRTLAAAGVVLDTQKIFDQYAKSIGTTADKLSDAAKKTALVEAGLKAMDEKVVQGENSVDDYAHRWEKLTATLTNLKDNVLLKLGETLVNIHEGLTTGLSFQVDLLEAKVLDFFDKFKGGHEHFADQVRAEMGKTLEAAQRGSDAAKKAAEERLAQGRSAYRQLTDLETQFEALHGPGSSKVMSFEQWDKLAEKMRMTGKQAQEMAKALEASRLAVDKFFAKLAGERNLGAETLSAETEDSPLADVFAQMLPQKPRFDASLAEWRRYEAEVQKIRERLTAAPQVNELDTLTARLEGDLTQGEGFAEQERRAKERNELIKFDASKDGNTYADEYAKALEKGFQAHREDFVQSLKGFLGGDEDQAAALVDQLLSEESAVNFETRLGQMTSALQQLHEAFGPFGDDADKLAVSLGFTADQMVIVAENAEAMKGITVGAFQQITNAMGQSIAAQLAGDTAKRKSLKDVTRDTLEQLAAQAFGRALFETAAGLADLALALTGFFPQNFASATTHFASAAAFAAIGGGSALGARAVAGGSFDSSATGSSAGRSTSSRQDFGTGTRTDRNATADRERPVFAPQIVVFPGGEAEAGRAVNEALKKWQEETGQPIGKQ